jgi:CO dehydrogenase maturation factor
MTGKVFTNKRIGILGKGGSGKSTITVLLARAFIHFGYQVCVLDADSTNVGIHRAFGFENPPVSLIDYFGGTVFTGGKVTCPVDDPAPLPGAHIPLTRIPARYYSSDEKGLVFFQLGKMGEQGPGAGCDGPVSKITRDLSVQGIGDHPVTLIDVKAGLEDSARGVITSMDWIITVVDPATASIQIATDIRNLISRIRAGELPATKHLEHVERIEEANRIYREARIKESFVLLNKIRNPEIESYVAQQLKERGLTTIGTIFEDSSISFSWLEGKPLEGSQAPRDILVAFRRLEQAVKDYKTK